MKKIFTMLFFTAATIQFASAQSFKQKDNYQDRYQAQKNDNRFNDQHQSNDYGFKNNNGRNDDRDRQVAYDRMNQQYDQRINDFKNDRSLSRYERDSRIKSLEQERQQQSKSFGKGLIVAGVASILLGALFSH